MSKYDPYIKKSAEGVRCVECFHKISTQTNNPSAGLKYHFEKKHPKLWTKICGESERRSRQFTGTGEEAVESPSKKSRTRQLTVEDSFSMAISSSSQSRRLDRALVHWLTLDGLPLSTTESDGFRHFFKTAAPSYSIKPRGSYAALMEEMVGEYKKALQNELDAARWISVGAELFDSDLFDSDLRRSEAMMQQLLSVTAHFVKEGQLATRVLTTAPFEEAEDVKRILSSSFAEYKLTGRVHALILDDGLNLKKIGDLLGQDIIFYDCFAHILQKAVTCGLKKLPCISALVEKLEEIIRNVRKSFVDKKDREVCKSLDDVPEAALLKNYELRWSVLYAMLEKFSRNRRSIEIFLAERTNYPSIYAEDWEVIEKLTAVLEPIQKASSAVQNRIHLASCIIPLCKVVIGEMRKSSALRAICDEIVANLGPRLAEYEANDGLVLSTILDPRFKTKLTRIDGNEMLLRRAESWTLVVDEETLPSSTASRGTFEDLFDQYEVLGTSTTTAGRVVDNRQRAQMEIEKYLAIPASRSVEPLLYWSQTETKAEFPVLSQMASKYLSAPASLLLAGDRVFSGAGKITTDLMGTKKLSDALFLQQNIKLMGFELS